MADKIVQLRINREKESDFIKDIEIRKTELGLTSDNSYVRYLLKQDTFKVAQNRLNELMK